MPNWEEIRKEWETSEVTFKELAEKYDLKASTIRSRKNREKWQRNATDENATQRATKKKSVAMESDDKTNSQKKKSTSNSKAKKQRNRSGNPNPVRQFTKRNRAAVKHGLYANYLHEEQQEIIDQMQDISLADQIWMQIEIKFSAIIRLQKIMWVAYDDDHLKVESGYSNSMEGDSVSYKVAFAHERYESYIKAQARAMAEYRNLVKQYIELTDEFDERRIRLEGMQANIDRVKAETEKVTATDDDSPIEIRITRAGDS